MVQPVERALVLPAAEIAVHRATERQVFRHRPGTVLDSSHGQLPRIETTLWNRK